jgi:dTDP-4-amino-4,6-dideoxygalactose transaminase
MLASIYNEALSSIEEVILPEAPNSGDHFDVFQNYEIQAEKRDELKLYLEDKGIGTLIQWGGKAIHQFKKLNFQQDLPVTDKIFSKILMLPLNMFITDNDINYVIDTIKNFYSK